MSRADKSKTTKVYQVDNTPNYSKVDKVYVINPSDNERGDGGVADEVAWENVTGKPSLFPPAEHNHDERYYTKDEIDAPEFMSDRVDNITVELEGRELKVRSVDGLVVGIADINDWLAGTSGNIQTQIDVLGDELAAVTAGMRFRGKLETYAELQDVTNMENGDLFVVLTDENRDGGRSMYVYSEEKGAWDFIGAFTFKDEFTAMKDTPNDYQDGKYLRSSSSGIVYDDVDYQALKNKPESTITAIDGSVEKAHEHSNKSALDKLGVNDDGELTIDGVVYAPRESAKEKDYLFLGKFGNRAIRKGDPLHFDSFFAGNMSYTNSTFTLKKDKVYRGLASVLFTQLESSIGLRLYDVTEGKIAEEYPDAKWLYAPKGNSPSSGNGVFDFIIKPSETKEFQIIADSISGSEQVTQYSRNSTLSIFEI